MSTALVKAEEFSAADLNKYLQQTGWAEQSSGEGPLRMKLAGNMLTTPDGDMYVYNPSKPKIPALTVRIVKPPEEYHAMYVSDANATLMHRPELSNTFSKRYIHPNPDHRVWESDLAFDDIKNAGLFDDNGKQIKPQWKADILLQIMPDSGTLTGDEPIYILSLSTTSVIEFKGAALNPDGGAISELNFIRKLCKFAMEADPEHPQQAVTAALTSLTLGGVVAEVRLLPAENKELARNWTIISFDPIHIEPMFEGDLLLSGSDNAEAGN